MPALDKYIKHHSLPNKGKNQDSMHMRCIALHLPAGNEHMGPQDNIQEEVEEEIEEKVVLAEVDSDDNWTDGDLDSESTDYESELINITMSSEAKGTKIIYFLLNQCVVLSSLILHCLNWP